MEYEFNDAVAVLWRTPRVVRALLEGLPDRWTTANEGGGTWTPYDIVGHLIHADRTDWIPRVEHVLRHGGGVPFPAFDREGMLAASRGRSLAELLDTLDEVRTESLDRLVALQLTPADLERVGRHPEFGEVLLRQHLATWVAHDLTHISQIVRVMAKQYSEAVGPWRAYLSILR